MLDLDAVAGMIFTLLVIGLLGGFILLLPIARRLGAYLEQRLEQGRTGAVPQGDQLRQLREAVLQLQRQVERIQERQEFTDNLLGEGRQPPAITDRSGLDRA